MNNLCRSKIEYVRNPDGSQGYGCNPLTGQCQHFCSYCWAEEMRIRFKQSAEMEWHPEELEKIGLLKKPSTIFIGSSYDIWGNWVKSNWKRYILDTVEALQSHTFLFLTKNPKDYKYINIPLDNCWFGASVDTIVHASYISFEMGGLPVKNKFLSAEPLLADISDCTILNGIKWLTIGCLTKNGRPVKPENGGTKLEWVLPLIEEAKEYKIPIFLKNNLIPMMGENCVKSNQKIPYSR